jgi:AcrR family transcriptional regulator
VGTRLTAEQRKRQLIGIGLKLLISTPLDEFSLDQVAEQAGISRSLLFHHFPTKRDYYLAVVRAASRRMLHAVDTAAEGTGAEGTGAAGTGAEGTGAGAGHVRAMTEGLVAFIRRRREPYLTFVRGSAGGDLAVREINAQTRDELIERFAAELAVAQDDAIGRLQVRGWLAYAEELVLTWTGERASDEHDAELVDLLLTGLGNLLR